jgi:predicted small secreted protein
LREWIMKKFAVAVSVLALGLAACGGTTEENAMENEVTVENEAEFDTNLAVNELDAGNAAENALDDATNAIDNAGEAVENAGEAVADTADNATE